MKINLKKLREFIVKAKKNTYASANRMKIPAERPKHAELEFSEAEFYYRDSYVGFFQAPGVEEVRLGKNSSTIWAMAYSGGMLPKFQTDKKFAKSTFDFLKEALKSVNGKIPYRGPEKFQKEEWVYLNKVEGDIKRFKGHEKIMFQNKEVFNQDYIGGLVIEK